MDLRILSQRFTRLVEVSTTNFSSVYRAIDSVGKHAVALKVAAGRRGIQRNALRKEFNFLSSCSHPNIVEVYDYGTDDTACPFFTMKWIPGTTLGDSGLHPQLVVPHVIPSLTSALAEIHSAGFVYGDLNPSNVLITKNNGGLDTTLIDFGLISRIGASYPRELRGTIDFMAPEVHRGDPLTPATDVYSFGLLLKQLIGDPDGPGGRALAPFLHLSRLLKLLKQCLNYYPDSRPQGFRQIEEIWWQDIARTGARPAGRITPARKSRRLYGRAEDLKQLRHHCRDLLEKSGGVVLVSGVAGVGKTALVRHHCRIAQMQGSATLRITCDDLAEKVDLILDAIDTWVIESKDGSAPDHRDCAEFFIYLESGRRFDAGLPAAQRLIAKIMGRRIVCIVECESPVKISLWPDIRLIVLQPLIFEHFEGLAQRLFETGSLIPALATFLHQASGGIPGLLEAKRLEFTEHLGRGRPAENFAWRKPPRLFVDDFIAGMAETSMETQKTAAAISLVRGPFSIDDITGLSGVAAGCAERSIDSFVMLGYLTSCSGNGARHYDIAYLWVIEAFKAFARHRAKDGDTDTLPPADREREDRLRSFLARPLSPAGINANITDYGDLKFLTEAVVASRDICLHRGPWRQVTSAVRRSILHDVVLNYESMGSFRQARRWTLRLAGDRTLARPDSGGSAYEVISTTVGLLTRFCTPRQRSSWIKGICEDFPNLEPRAKALLISEMGVVDYHNHNLEKALARFFEAEAILAKTDDSPGLRARNLNRLGSTYYSRRQYAQAVKYLNLAEEEAKKASDPEVLAIVGIAYGLVLLDQGKTRDARNYLTAAQQYADDAHHLKLSSIARRNVMLCIADLEPSPAAVTSAQEALSSARKVGDVGFSALGQSNLGWAYLRAGNLRDAYKHISSSIAIANARNDYRVLSLAYLNMARLFRLQGRLKESVRYAIKSYRAADSLSSAPAQAEALRELSLTLLMAGHAGRAVGFLGRVSGVESGPKDLRRRFFDDAAATEVDISYGKLDSAARRLEAWQKATADVLLPGWVCLLDRLKGLLQSASGNYLSALSYFKEAACQARAYERYDLLIPIYEDIVGCCAKIPNNRVGLPYAVELSRLYQKVGRMHQNDKLEAAIQALMQQPHDAGAARMVFQLSESLTRFSDKHQLLDHLLRLAVDYFGADRGALISKHAVSGHLFVEAQHGLDTTLDRDDALEISRSVIKTVTETSECLKIDNAAENPMTNKKKSIILNNIQSVLCVPVSVGHGIWGVLYLDNRSVPGAFAHTDIRILQALANFMALGIDQTDEMDRLRLRGAAGTTNGDSDLPFIAASPKMRSLLSTVDKIADSEMAVVILGENGTGKDMLAKYIHEKSERRSQPLITMNCAGLVETLVDTELFGIENNVATGVNFREGKFKLADGGTLFLNEIGDLPLVIQSKLLHALQYRIIERVGGSPMAVDVRFIAATNRNLEKMVEAGEFRQDLFYRVNSLMVTIPPLRERIDDIPALAKSFLDHFSRKYRRVGLELTNKNFGEFANYSWPGNVRELKGLIERGVLLADGRQFPLNLTRAEAQTISTRPASSRKLNTLLEKTERDCIIEALGRSGWNQSKAANWLGLSESSLRSKIKRLKVVKPRRL